MDAVTLMPRVSQYFAFFIKVTSKYKGTGERRTTLATGHRLGTSLCHRAVHRQALYTPWIAETYVIYTRGHNHPVTI